MTRPTHVASYYAATANPSPEHPVLEGEVDADVCVVGGGFTGLAAALHLAERGYDVVLLEAARVGWGASGRNGGQMISGFSRGIRSLEGRAGRDDARRLWNLAEEAKAVVRERVARHRIQCDLKSGYLLAAYKPGHVDWMRAEAETLGRDYGYGALRVLSKGEVAAMLGTGRYHGGVLDADSGHLHPLNYALGLAAAAGAAGVRIFEGSRVLAFEREAQPGVRAARGAVRARYVIICCNAYLGGLVPKLSRTIMPVGACMSATEPLGFERARGLIRDDIAVCDSKFVVDYYRLSADHRLLFGGGATYNDRVPRDLKRFMRRLILKVFPQLEDVRIDFAWTGDVAITVSRFPNLGRLAPDVFFAQGFSGQGVALTSLAGKLLAEAVAGTAERFDVFARLKHLPFPGGPFRKPILVLATTYYRLRDLI